jgi:hypothetical protein
MYILYVDESGVEQIGAGSSHFVLLGLMIPAEHWKSLDTALENTKDSYRLREIEIHTAWMCRRYAEQESIANFSDLSHDQRKTQALQEIRRRAGAIGVSGNRRKEKSYRKEARLIEPYIHLTREERIACLEELAQQLASWTDVRIFADAISKADFVNAQISPYEMAFEQVLARFQAFLSFKHGTGIMVHDKNETVAPRLTRLARQFHSNGTLYRQIPDIVETPLFVDSSMTSMIQMADLCAYALRRLLENSETRFWDIIEPRVDRIGVRSVGIRHYTGRRHCACRICSAHGR